MLVATLLLMWTMNHKAARPNSDRMMSFHLALIEHLYCSLMLAGDLCALYTHSAYLFYFSG